MCVHCVVLSQSSAGEHCLCIGDALKMSLFGGIPLYDTVFTASMIFVSQRGLLFCLCGITNGK